MLLARDKRQPVKPATVRFPGQRRLGIEGRKQMNKQRLSRRRFMARSGAASLAIATPFVRTAHAAGKLAVGFWDHWVPGANDATKSLVEEWAAREKVEVQMDFIPTQGMKLQMTTAAES